MEYIPSVYMDKIVMHNCFVSTTSLKKISHRMDMNSATNKLVATKLTTLTHSKFPISWNQFKILNFMSFFELDQGIIFYVCVVLFCVVKWNMKNWTGTFWQRWYGQKMVYNIKHGPILFILYINDIVDSVEHKCTLIRWWSIVVTNDKKKT